MQRVDPTYLVLSKLTWRDGGCECISSTPCIHYGLYDSVFGYVFACSLITIPYFLSALGCRLTELLSRNLRLLEAQ